MKRLFLNCSLALLLTTGSTSDSLAQIIINGYAKVSSISGTTINFDAGHIDISNDAFEVGERAIIMQMQDDVIGNTNNISSFGDIGSIQSAGLYEVVTIASVTASSVTIASSLQNTYNTGANSSVQLITYRLMDDGGGDYETTSDITALPWDGDIGGVVALRVDGTLNLLHSIIVDGDGFRGREDENPGGSGNCDSTTFIATSGGNHGDKGEGIYKTGDPAFASARGKILNGGGGANSHNGGGGGGGNYSAGGNGGPGWRDGDGSTVVSDWHCDPYAGGLGGIALSSYISSSRIFMGGGGGAGEGNNNGATPGGNGGGIILISANTIATNSCSGVRISANGLDAASPSPVDEGAGGAGAAGSIVLSVQNFNVDGSCTLTVEADGGDGGDVNYNGIHGGGGGGGMGVAIFSISGPINNVTVSTDPGEGGLNHNEGVVPPAEPGGGTSGTGEGVVVDGNSPLPVQLIEFKGFVEDKYVVLTWKTASEIDNDYFEVQLSKDGQSFSTIGKVNGTGTTNELQSYQFSHFNQFNGTLYYRLKQVDFDGAFEYSRTIYINSNGITEPLNASIYPNPSNGKNVQLQIYSGAPELYDIAIYNLLGRVVKSFSIGNEEIGINGIELRTSSLAKGIYNVEISQGQHKVVKKLIVD